MKRIWGPSSAIFAGNAVSAAMGFVVLGLLTRSLDPVSFGLLAALINIIDLGIVVIDAFLLAGVVVTASRYVSEHPKEAAIALKMGLLLRLPIVAAILLVSFFCSEALAVLLHGDPAMADPVRLTFVALALLSVYGFLNQALQSRQKFLRLALNSTWKNLARVVLIGSLFWMGSLD